MMKKIKNLLKISAIAAIAVAIFVAADHIDAPAVAGGASDITDFYSFQGENPNNIVFVANVQGLLSPSATANAEFDEDLMIEFNIDNTGDNVEDLVIQAVPRNGIMYFAGPYEPSQTGLVSTYDNAPGSQITQVRITPYGSSPFVQETASGGRIFAGPRDDPFFFDFVRYTQILSGSETSFANPGNDTFAGTNVLSVVAEVPKSLLGGSGTINTWVETKRKQ